MYKQIQIARVARKTKSDQTKQSIFLRVRPSWKQDVNEFTFSTKICIEESKWNIDKRQVKGASMESQRINLQLNKLEEQVYQLFSDYLKTNPDPKLKEFKTYLEFKLYNKGNGSAEKIYVSDLCDRYVKLHKSELGDKRIKRYEFVGSCINDFNQQKYSTTKIELEVLSRDWRQEFKQFLMDRFNYKPSTLNGYLKVLHSAVRDVYESGHLNKYPFYNCKFDKCEEQVRYLTYEELSRLENFKTDNERLQRAADIFLFATQTGLSYADMLSLTNKQIELDKDGVKSIVKIRTKSKVRSYIPISEPAFAILNKYRFHPLLSGTDLLLPVIHINDYNQLLKMVAIHCKIDKNLSSHIARHTFATTVWLSNKGRLEGLKSILGHKKIQTTERYGKITDENVKNEASMVFENQAKKGALTLHKIKMSNNLKNDD
jgi:integrase